MKNIQCIGRFNYNRHKIIAMVKITDVDENEYFDIGGYYPIIYDFAEKTFSIMNNLYDLNMCQYYCNEIEDIFRYLANTKGCLFDVMYYIEYLICKQLIFASQEQSTFEIEWFLKIISIKMQSKSKLYIY